VHTLYISYFLEHNGDDEPHVYGEVESRGRVLDRYESTFPTFCCALMVSPSQRKLIVLWPVSFPIMTWRMSLGWICTGVYLFWITLWQPPDCWRSHELFGQTKNYQPRSTSNPLPLTPTSISPNRLCLLYCLLSTISDFVLSKRRTPHINKIGLFFPAVLNCRVCRAKEMWCADYEWCVCYIKCGARDGQWHCATSWEVVGSIPDGAIVIFHLLPAAL